MLALMYKIVLFQNKMIYITGNPRNKGLTALGKTMKHTALI